MAERVTWSPAFPGDAFSATRALESVQTEQLGPDHHRRGMTISNRLERAKDAGRHFKEAGKDVVQSREARMLGRNTVASIASFLLDLAILAALVELAGFAEVPAAAIAFIVPLVVFYFLQREWVFPGTERGVAAGFVYFLIFMGIGFVSMLAVFWTLLEVTDLHYLIARVLASVVYGIVVFVLNGVFNFRQL